MQRLSDWLAPVGLTAIAVGVGFALVGLGNYPFVTVLLLVGLVMLLLWVFTHLPQLRTMLGLRSTQANLNVIVSVLAVVVILIAVNAITTRYSVQFDVTEARLFSLAPQTQSVLETLELPVQVSVFSESPQLELQNRLEQFRRTNPAQFSYEIINPNTDPVRARELEVTSNERIVVTAGERQEQFPIPSPLRLERVLTPTLIQLTNTRQRSIYFVQGHGELPLEAQEVNVATLSQAITALEEDGYLTSPLNLIESEGVPEDASVVVVAAPELAWLPAEVEQLTSYLDRGGRALLLLDPIANPQLDSLYEDWGLQLADDVVVDVSQISRSLGGGPYSTLVTRYGDHPITVPLADKGLASIFPFARSLSAQDGADAVALLITGDRTWMEWDLDNSDVAFDPEVDRPGPVTLGLAFSRPVEPSDSQTNTDDSVDEPPANVQIETGENSETEENSEDTGSEVAGEEDEIAGAEIDTLESRLVAIGNSQFAVDGNFAQLGNGDLFLNAINWLSDRDEAITIRPKSPTNRRFNLTPSGVQWLRLLSSILLPAIALSMGGLMWWKRR